MATWQEWAKTANNNELQQMAEHLGELLEEAVPEYDSQSDRELKEVL